MWQCNTAAAEAKASGRWKLYSLLWTLNNDWPSMHKLTTQTVDCRGVYTCSAMQVEMTAYIYTSFLSIQSNNNEGAFVVSAKLLPF